ncbi:MAG: methylmalonyl-CoA epimerase [Longimicrobiales bacterium]|nr:methylmalonyl-CoA epimerase [Longimicrobiales bacterium]
MNELPLDHVAIAVHDLESAVPIFERLTGSRGSPVEEVASQHVRVAFVGALELLEPTNDESTVARFLARRGPGLHHVAYRVDDLAATLARIRVEGVETIDDEPRRGAGGHLVAFLAPKSTGGVLTELVERSADTA